MAPSDEFFKEYFEDLLVNKRQIEFIWRLQKFSSQEAFTSGEQTFSQLCPLLIGKRKPLHSVLGLFLSDFGVFTYLEQHQKDKNGH